MSKIYKIVSKTQTVLFVSAFIILTFAASNALAKGFKTGFALAINTLVPSLFPFMVISSFISNCEISTKIESFFEPIIKFLFNLPGCTILTILLGLIGGYPVGTIGIVNLCEKKLISETQAKRMLLFLVNAGPAFVITAVGVRLLHNLSLGIMLFLSQSLASILLGIITKFIFNDFFYSNLHKSKSKYKLSFSNNFVQSVEKSTKSMLNMCAFVVLFSAFLETLNNDVIIASFKKLFCTFHINCNIGLATIVSFFEITAGCKALCQNCASPGLIAFFLAFGGLCIHLQIFSCAKNIKFSKFLFFLFRILHGFLSACLCHIFLHFFGQSIQTFNTAQNSTIKYDFISNSAMIVIFAICFLCALTKENINFKKNNVKF